MLGTEWYRDRVLQCLSRARSTNEALNAFISIVQHNQVEKQADISHTRWNTTSQKSIFDGVPFVSKDIFCTDSTFLDEYNKPLGTTCGSLLLKNHVSPYTADILHYMTNSLGMILLGKANMDEFGMGSFGIHSHFGPCRNPLDIELSPGGSSSGSAAAVSCDIVPIALGSDTGGSVRLPAAYCNIVGFKPSYGRLSRYGMVSHASSLDTVGILCKDLYFLNSIWPLLANANEIRDNTITSPKPPKIKSHDIPRIGIIQECHANEMLSHEGSRNTYIMAISKLQKDAQIIQISIPWISICIASYYIISTVEAASCLSRFNGLCYPKDQEIRNVQSFYDLACEIRTKGFGNEVKRRILLGTFLSSTDQHSSFYNMACKFRSYIQKEWNTIFDRYQLDAIVIPTCSNPPPKISDLCKEENHGYWSKVENHWIQDTLTVPANLLGIPSISVPISHYMKVDPSLYSSWQWMGNRGNDEELLETIIAIHSYSNG